MAAEVRYEIAVETPDYGWDILRNDLTNLTANMFGCKSASRKIQPVYDALNWVGRYVFTVPVWVDGKEFYIQSGDEAFLAMGELVRKLRKIPTVEHMKMTDEQMLSEPPSEYVKELINNELRVAVRKAWIAARLGQRYLLPVEIAAWLTLTILDLVVPQYIGYCQEGREAAALVGKTKKAVRKYIAELEMLLKIAGEVAIEVD